DDVLDALRNHDPDRDLPEVGRIGGVEPAAPSVEAHLPFERAGKIALERAHVHAIASVAGWPSPRSSALDDRERSAPARLARERRRASSCAAARWTRYGSASLRLSSSPSPGRPGSGCKRPPIGQRTPSKNRCSMRTWS